MISVSFATYDNSKLFQSTRKPHLVVGGKIISATVSNARVIGLPEEDSVIPSFGTQHVSCSCIRLNNLNSICYVFFTCLKISMLYKISR